MQKGHKEAVTVSDAGDAGSYALALQVQVRRFDASALLF